MIPSRPPSYPGVRIVLNSLRHSAGQWSAILGRQVEVFEDDAKVTDQVTDEFSHLGRADSDAAGLQLGR